MGSNDIQKSLSHVWILCSENTSSEASEFTEISKRAITPQQQHTEVKWKTLQEGKGVYYKTKPLSVLHGHDFIPTYSHALGHVLSDSLSSIQDAWIYLICPGFLVEDKNTSYPVFILPPGLGTKCWFLHVGPWGLMVVRVSAQSHLYEWSLVFTHCLFSQTCLSSEDAFSCVQGLWWAVN